MVQVNSRVRDVSVAVFCAASCLAQGAGSARADGPFEQAVLFPAVDEIRLGALAPNLEGGGSEEGDVLLSGELLFGRPARTYGDPLRDFILRPRPHIGFAIAPDEGTNQLYAGVTWDFRLGDRLYLEASFGGTLHDGPTDSGDPDSYGCALLFRESVALGYAISEHWRVLLTVDHMSNASLCDQNQGLTNAGVRLGYRW
jgi:lipid A 3-O-deacylase